MICKVCKRERKIVYKKHYLGVKPMWECKCGCRPIKKEDQV